MVTTPSYVSGYAFTPDYQTTMHARADRRRELLLTSLLIRVVDTKHGYNHNVLTLEVKGTKSALEELSGLDIVLLCNTTADFGATVQSCEITGSPEEATLRAQVRVSGND